jgi:hypothetical protein
MTISWKNFCTCITRPMGRTFVPMAALAMGLGVVSIAEAQQRELAPISVRPIQQGSFDGAAGAPANDDCANADAATLDHGDSVTFTGDNSGATPDCPSFSIGNGNAWLEITLVQDSSLTLEYCGTSPAFGNAWLNLAVGCPCDDFTAAAQFDTTSCGDNNVSMSWAQLAAGTYYYPILNDPANNASGPYTITVSAGALGAAGCEGSCGGQAPDGCWCDSSCPGFSDCCADFCDFCSDIDPAFCGNGNGGDDSCQGNCGGQAPGGCFCDSGCFDFADCCRDVCQFCPEQDLSGEICEAGGDCAGNCGGQAPSGCWCDDSCFGFSDCCDGVCVDCPTLSGCNGGPGDGECEGNCGGQAPSGCWCDDGCFGFSDCCNGVCDDCPNLSGCNGRPGAGCEGSCGGQSPEGCWCDASCSGFLDCCDDFCDFCADVDPLFCGLPGAGCDGHCGGQSPDGCWCDTSCPGFSDCCDDFCEFCSDIDPDFCEVDEPVACAVDSIEVLCAPDGSGSGSYTFEVTNNSGLDAVYVLVTPQSDGLAISPQMIPANIADGASGTFTVNLDGVSIDETFTLTVTLLDASFQECCSNTIDLICECLQVPNDSVSTECDADGNVNASFTFDNLTQDVLEHAYLFASGDTEISPSYFNLSSIQPGGSATLDVTISGARGGQYCFTLGIHDAAVVECCAQEVCIDLPDCDATADDSCERNCGGQAPAGCWCDSACTSFTDCCDDFCDFCSEIDPIFCGEPGAGCEGSCGGQSPDGCWCDSSCPGFSDCCDDFCDFCEDIDPVFCGGDRPTGECEGNCGGQAPSGCWCDDGCFGFSDCCNGVCDDCPNLSGCNGNGGGECEGNCGGQAPSGCWCDEGCFGFSDCCNGICDDCPALDGCNGGGGGGECEGNCGSSAPSGCFCDDACFSFSDCCNGVCDDCPELDGCSGAAPPSIPGDLNGDGIVNTADLLLLLSNWGPCPGEGRCSGDFNGDGVVNVADLLVLLNNWG